MIGPLEYVPALGYVPRSSASSRSRRYPTERGFLALHLACMPCAAYASHVPWDSWGGWDAWCMPDQGLGGKGRVMEYARLGNSGLTVSRIALGCMSFGDTSRGFSQWSLGDEE